MCILHRLPLISVVFYLYTYRNDSVARPDLLEGSICMHDVHYYIFMAKEAPGRIYIYLYVQNVLLLLRLAIAMRMDIVSQPESTPTPY